LHWIPASALQFKLLHRYGYCYRFAFTATHWTATLGRGVDNMTAGRRTHGTGSATTNPVGLDGLPLGECTRDPERWTTAADEDAKAICRLCPRRWACAREAVELPKAEGLWAGIVVPEAGRGRGHALRQLRELAERNGYPVRTRRILVEQFLESA
jgi:WhiB family redox-sensing transcriptional regulator